MTIYSIYKPKDGDRKSKKIVTADVVPEGVPLSDGGKKIGLLSSRLVVISTARRRRNKMLAGLALLLLMCFAAISVAAGLFVFRYVNRPYTGTCEVPYHEGTTAGYFQEKVEIDQSYFIFEKLEVPPVLDSRRSTAVHDFEKNLTAIVDRDHGRCYIMNLNRTIVQPPKSFLDLLAKFQSGYYIPDVEVIRERYRVAFPQVEHLKPFGIYIRSECEYFETYRLVRDDQPYAMIKKRSAEKNRLRGTYNLGETMGKYLQIVEIVN